MMQDVYSNGHLTNYGTNRSSGGPVIGYGVTPSTTTSDAFLSATGIAAARTALVMDASFRWFTGGDQTVSIGGAATMSQKMVLTNAGYLGIGTPSPSTELEVIGSTTLYGNAGTLKVKGTNHVYIELYPSGTTREAYIGFAGVGTKDIQFTNENTGGHISLIPGTGGRVGISTTSPVSRLALGTFVGAMLTYVDNTTYFADPSLGIIVGTSNTGNANVWQGLNLTNNTYSVGAYSPIVGFSSRSNSGTYNVLYGAIYGIPTGDGSSADWVKGDIVFATAPSNGTVERMRITSAGNVGINNNSPADKLDVSGDVVLGSSAERLSLASGRIGFNRRVSNGDIYTSNAFAYQFNHTQSTTNTSDYLAIQVYNTGGTQVTPSSLVINGAGNVGIGTTTPYEKLEVAGAISASGGWVGDGNQGAVTTIGFQSGYGFIQAVDWGVAYQTFAVNPNGGLVGIGKANPQYLLDVNGTMATDYTLTDSATPYRLVKPRGGVYTTTTTTLTGAIKITYPVGYTNTMHHVKVRVYEYVDDKSFTIHFGGYNYAPEGSFWINCFAYIEGSAGVDRNFNVRFGYDGSKMVVYIGELASTWTYPQVFIDEVGLGYLGQSTTWADGTWSIGFEASAFQNVTVTKNNNNAHNFARNGTSTFYDIGNVGIGTVSPSYKLHVVGDGYINTGSLGVNVAPNATDGRIDASNDIVAYSSDKRLKTNIKLIENPIDKIKKIDGFTFNWNDKANQLAGYNKDISVSGVYAQQIQEVLPEAVKLAPFDNDGNDNSISGENYLTVQYEKLVPLLIEAIKEQQKEIEKLKNRLY
jgi:hypothetical protein